MSTPGPLVTTHLLAVPVIVALAPLVNALRLVTPGLVVLLIRALA